MWCTAKAYWAADLEGACIPVQSVVCLSTDITYSPNKIFFSFELSFIKDGWTCRQHIISNYSSKESSVGLWGSNLVLWHVGLMRSI